MSRAYENKDKDKDKVNVKDLFWQAGWLQTAERLDSPNFGERPDEVCIDLIVIHSISLPPGEYGNGCVQQLVTNQLDWDAHPYFQTIREIQVSTHFFITRLGQVWQFVSTDKRAWHAGKSGHLRPEGLKNNCNDFSIGIELEGLEGNTFEDAQYKALLALIEQIRGQYPIAYILGHEHIAAGRKFDPGSGFAWQKLAQSPVTAQLHLPHG